MTAPGAPAAPDVRDAAALPGVVRLDGVTLRSAGVDVLRGLTATAAPGAVTHLLGPAGAGKTAALRVLLGLSTPAAGTATVGGAPVRDLPAPGRVVGLVPAGPALHPGRRGRAALRVLAAGLGVPDTRVDEVLTLVGLGPGTPGAGAAERRGRATPAPLRRRLAVAAALLGDPRVLLVDEPARDLDPAGAAWLHGLLRRLADAGRTVVVAGRDPRTALAHDDPVVVLRGGACVHAGRARDLAAGEPVRVLAATRDPARLAGALVTAGTPDVRVLPDGRLDVVGTRAADVAGVARRAGVGLLDLREDLPDPERSYLRLTLGPAAPPW